MSIEIKPLAPALTADYLDFFDHRAFSDGSPNAPCYCNAFNLSAAQIQSDLFDRAAEYGGGATGWKRALRQSAERMVRDGTIRGYLAYDGPLSVGWCNANDRLNYFRVGEFDLDGVPADALPEDCPAPGVVKSVVCFEIAPDYRGRGVATLLLERVCRDARAEGYRFVEGYPAAQGAGGLAFTGPVGLYRKLGFEVSSREENTLVMRKALYRP